MQVGLRSRERQGELVGAREVERPPALVAQQGRRERHAIGRLAREVAARLEALAGEREGEVRDRRSDADEVAAGDRPGLGETLERRVELDHDRRVALLAGERLLARVARAARDHRQLRSAAAEAHGAERFGSREGELAHTAPLAPVAPVAPVAPAARLRPAPLASPSRSRKRTKTLRPSGIGCRRRST